MKKVSIILASLLCGWINLSAQQKINVQNGTKTAFYNDLETAVHEAVSGDTIYLPGAIIELQNHLVIDKKLTLIGAGWDIDSIGGLRPTQLKIKTGSWANLTFSVGSDGSFITGFYVNGIGFDNNAALSVANVTIARIAAAGISLGAGVSNIYIRESYITSSGLNGAGATDCWINNNIIIGTIHSLVDSHLYNNVFNYYVGGTRCVFENNYIGGGLTTSSSSTFNNNAFSGNITFPTGDNNNGFDNLVNQPHAGSFTGGDWTPKSLKLKSTSPLKNAGTDGSDIGMYGGNDPYKEGAVPFNPHIDEIVVSSITDKTGNLKVRMQVSSQNK
ncbi:MAG: hypothetical protein LBT25_00935 [Candidatus Symbiothrix sp.]|jgi:hypothetical protein|nr:hypothetical protein [Candidatus Symbiothrix sp.]